LQRVPSRVTRNEGRHASRRICRQLVDVISNRGLGDRPSVEILQGDRRNAIGCKT